MYGWNGPQSAREFETPELKALAIIYHHAS